MKNKVAKNDKGFTLFELIMVIAIIFVLTGVISAIFIRYIEKSKEAKDLAAVREAYTSIMAAVISEEGSSSSLYNETNETYEIYIPLTQTHEGWSTKGELNIGDISSYDDEGRRWFGTPGKDGEARVFYLADRGVVIEWSKVAELSLSKNELPYHIGRFFEPGNLSELSDDEYATYATTAGYEMRKGDKLIIKSVDDITNLKEFELIIFGDKGLRYDSGMITGSWRTVGYTSINGNSINDYVSVVDDTVAGETIYTFRADCMIAINYSFTSEKAAVKSKNNMAVKFRVDRK